MKFSLPKFKLPSLKLPKVKMPKFNFRFSLFSKTGQLSRAWKKFLKQIPPSYRHFIQSYPRHFIVIGDLGSGKSQLVQKYIDQERDIYSFETSYTNDPDVKFYLGQRYILQEISWPLIEDRSILAKKQLTSLWGRLYAHRNPIFVVTFNPLKWGSLDSEKINYYARLMLNKVALLSNLIDKPIEVRIAVTHMDMIEGYSEFNRILQMNGISLDFDLKEYDATTLDKAFEAYEAYLPLVLKRATADEHLKVLNFLQKLSDLQFCLDQFVRSLTQKEYEKKILSLTKGYFVSNQESDLGSDVFDYVQEMTPSVYIKRHYLKHKFASVSLAVIGVACVGSYVAYKRTQLDEIRNKVALLEKYQRQEYLGEILPHIQVLDGKSPSKWLTSNLQPIYYSAFNQQGKDFVNYSREYILRPTFRKMVLNNQSEVEMMYFLSLVKATRDNKLGQLILENVHEWSDLLDLPQDFISTYVNLAKEPELSKVYIDEFNALYTKTPYTDHSSWFSFFDRLNHVIDGPHTLETHLPDLKLQAALLHASLEKLDKYSLSSFLCKKLMEDDELRKNSQFLPKIRLIQDLRDNSEVVRGLLTMVKDHSIDTTSLASQNMREFLGSLDQIVAASQDLENKSYHFILGDKRWKFDSQQWNDLLIKPRIKKIVEDYLVNNRNAGVEVFFKNAPELLNFDISYLADVFPAFKDKTYIPSYYTVTAYEKNIFTMAEQLAKLNQSPLIPGEVRSDLSQFIAHNVDNYAREYKAQYEDVIRRIYADPQTFEEATAIVDYITEPLSSYSHFLHTYRSNLKLPESDSLVLFAMKNQLSELAFFNNLMPEELDKPGKMHEYQAILRNILADARGESPLTKDQSFGVLDRYLSPLSRMSYNILTERSCSYQTAVNEWLDEVNVPRKFHSFFLSPVDWIHEFGLHDLEHALANAWQAECEPSYVALFERAPFSPTATDFVTVKELEQTLNPTSDLWGRIRGIFGDVCVINNHRWQPQQVNLDPQIVDKLNALAHATAVLWDADGNRQPLNFKIKTVPFSGDEENGRRIQMSYLVTNGQRIYNGNQLPLSMPMEVNWWDPEEIVYGFELVETKTGVKPLRDSKEEPSEWNFYKFLKKADSQDGDILSWTIPGVQIEQFSLEFEEKPWGVLNASL